MTELRFRVDRIVTFKQLGVAVIEGEFLSGVVQVGDCLWSARGTVRVRGVVLGAASRVVSITCDAVDADLVSLGEVLLSQAKPVGAS